MVPPLSIFGAMRWRRRMSLPLSSTDTTHTSDEAYEQGEREVHAAQLGSWLSNVRRDAGSVRFLKCLRCIRAAADAIDADPERLSYATANCLITSTSYRCDSCEDTLEQGQPCVAASAAMVKDEVDLFKLLEWVHQHLDIFEPIAHSVVLDTSQWSKDDISRILAAIKRLLLQFLAVESAHREEYQLDRVDQDNKVLLDYRNHYAQRYQAFYYQGLDPGDRGFAAWKVAKSTFLSDVIDVVCGIEGCDWLSMLDAVPINFRSNTLYI
ncbi:uncharacterized protein E0L32_005018 [Thyridium curvatum]|uniref:Uncharacterized protein n=1 Tax=Thyridium curvatum TaxID=1093900 RepID=A0A507BBY4_9PEZI|nr:uncharacterized protein E0L32_005018 [Thyridium curvatum]TPX14909.1 hypothetical protein E0L32_005018 [Thyridium curvatum]